MNPRRRLLIPPGHLFARGVFRAQIWRFGEGFSSTSEDSIRHLDRASFPAAEEIEAVSRASAMGWKGGYNPEVVVRHHHGRKAGDIAALTKWYAIGRGAFHMKLLLRGHKFLWFAQSVYQLRWRYRSSNTTVLWELVGAAKYGCMYLT